MRRFSLLFMLQLVTAAVVVNRAAAQTPAQLSAESKRLKSVLKDSDVGKHWFYDDIGRAIDVAKETGKPLFVAFR